MNRIVVHSRVGADGVLQLAVPLGVAEADREVEVTIEPAAPEQTTGSEQEEWQQFVRETAGAWQGDLERPEQGENGRTTMTVRWQDYIEERKEVMAGKPVVKGTRLTVEFLLKQVGAGMTHQELLDQYPTLRPEHIRAAMMYAADVVTMDESI